jgi:exodeoxyribonuclease VII large subunit
MYIYIYNREIFKKQKSGLEQLSQHLFRVVNYNLVNKFQDLEIILLHIEANAQKKITVSRDIELEGQLERIQIATRFSIDQERHKIKQLEDLLTFLNPLQLLEKGYTISTVNDQDLNKLSSLQPGDVLKTLSNQHLITSTINKIEKTS